MIKHIVMWKLKEQSNGATRCENAMLMKGLLDACRESVPGILKFEAIIAQEALDSTCDVVLYSEFASRAALDAYNKHPSHQLMKSRVAPLREERHSFDYEVGEREPEVRLAAIFGAIVDQPLYRFHILLFNERQYALSYQVGRCDGRPGSVALWTSHFE